MNWVHLLQVMPPFFFDAQPHARMGPGALERHLERLGSLYELLFARFCQRAARLPQPPQGPRTGSAGVPPPQRDQRNLRLQ